MFYYLLLRRRKSIQCSNNLGIVLSYFLLYGYLTYRGFTVVIDLAAYKKLPGAVEACILFTYSANTAGASELVQILILLCAYIFCLDCQKTSALFES